MTRPGSRTLALAVWSAIAIAVVTMALGLPPRTFFAGDSGVKLIVARNAISHPSHPLDIDLPKINGNVATFVGPFFRIHDDHAHAATPDLFPLLSAVFIALFGIRGSYLLPAVGFMATLWAIGSLGVALDIRRSRTLLILAAALCTPLLFYGLEFWEHAPAAAAAAAATVLLTTRRSSAALILAGALAGLSILLRPEAVCYAVALLVGSRWLPGPRLVLRDFLAFGAGMLISFLPLATLFAMSSRQLFGTHVTRNMAGVMSGWWTNRLDYLSVWLWPSRAVWLSALAAIAALAVVSRITNSARLTTIVYIAGLTFVAAVAIVSIRGGFERASIWNAAPAVLVVLVTPRVRDRDGRTFLWVVAVVSLLLVAAAAPHDGGAQWGPRFLLLSFIPLAVLTADALEAASRRSRVAGAIAIAVVLVLSAGVQRRSYRDLRGSKNLYERMVAFVERETPADSVVVTDLWWFDMVTAALYPSRQVLLAEDGAAAEHVFASVSSLPQVFVAHSSGESTNDALLSDAEKFGFLERRRVEVPVRSLVIVEYDKR